MVVFSPSCLRLSYILKLFEAQRGRCFVAMRLETFKDRPNKTSWPQDCLLWLLGSFLGKYDMMMLRCIDMVELCTMSFLLLTMRMRMIVFNTQPDPSSIFLINPIIPNSKKSSQPVLHWPDLNVFNPPDRNDRNYRNENNMFIFHPQPVLLWSGVNWGGRGWQWACLLWGGSWSSKGNFFLCLIVRLGLLWFFVYFEKALDHQKVPFSFFFCLG